MRVWTLSAGAMLVAATLRPVPGFPQEPGVEPNNVTGEPLGGGPGYSRTVDPGAPGVVVVHDATRLRLALDVATPGSVIYVDDGARLDLTASPPLRLREEVTLASGRGRNGSLGALLYTTTFPDAMIRVEGANARITGLRIQGPSKDRSRKLRRAHGILSGGEGLEVDNCELLAWTSAAIRIDDSRARIHNNNIHHNLRDGAGYGVMHSGVSFSVIQGNLFNANRHSVTGTGFSTQGYVAAENLVLWTATQPAFDMHAECEEGESVEGSPYGGGRIEIRDNTVLHGRTPAVTIRGTPRDAALVEGNAFMVPESEAVRAAHVPGRPGCEAVEQKPVEHVFVRDNGVGVERWLASSRATDHWHLLASSGITVARLAFGHFDSLEGIDVFNARGGEWFFSSAGRVGWEKINAVDVDMAELRLADFDGDGETDVFTSDGETWEVAWSGRGELQEVGRSTAPLSELHIADFNGDGRADVFRRSGEVFQVSFARPARGRMTRWRTVRRFPSTAPPPDGSGGEDPLAFGDFDGDGADDVLATAGGAWHAARGDLRCDIESETSCRLSSWRRLIRSEIELPDLGLGDFDGDARTDVIRIDDGFFAISFGGSRRWTELGQAPPFPLSEMAFVDVTGDGADDVFVAQQPPR